MDGKSREELCKYTRLYKGENMPPCIGGHTMYYWDSERFWVESQLSPELRDKEFVRHFPQDIGVIYQNYLQDFQKYLAKSLCTMIFQSGCKRFLCVALSAIQKDSRNTKFAFFLRTILESVNTMSKGVLNGQNLKQQPKIASLNSNGEGIIKE